MNRPDAPLAAPPKSRRALGDRIKRAFAIGTGLFLVGFGVLNVVSEPLGGAGSQRYVFGPIISVVGILVAWLGFSHFWYPDLYGSPVPGTPEHESVVQKLRWVFWTVGIGAPVLGVAAIVYLLTR